MCVYCITTQQGQLLSNLYIASRRRTTDVWTEGGLRKRFVTHYVWKHAFSYNNNKDTRFSMFASEKGLTRTKRRAAAGQTCFFSFQTVVFFFYFTWVSHVKQKKKPEFLTLHADQENRNANRAHAPSKFNNIACSPYFLWYEKPGKKFQSSFLLIFFVLKQNSINRIKEEQNQLSWEKKRKHLSLSSSVPATVHDPMCLNIFQSLRNHATGADSCELHLTRYYVHINKFFFLTGKEAKKLFLI